MLAHLGSGRTYKGKKTALSAMQEFLANWDGTPLRQELNISPSAWKELLAQEQPDFKSRKKEILAEIEAEGNRFQMARIYPAMVKVVCPIFMAVVLVTGLLSYFGIYSI